MHRFTSPQAAHQVYKLCFLLEGDGFQAHCLPTHRSAFAQAQSESLKGINRQLEMTNEQSVITSQTMDKIGTAMSMLGQSNQAQAEALKVLDDKTSRQNEMLTGLIASQGRRFMALFIVTMVVAAAAITLGILALTLGQ